MISNAMLFLLKTQCTMLYNILFEFIFGKTDTQDMFKHISDLKKIKYTGEVDKIDSSVSIYFFNHVSWSDFFIDNYITSGNGCYISRILVFFAVPFTCIYGIINNCIYFIRRNKKDVKHNLKICFENMIYKNKKKIIFYPEGTRNKTKNIIPLKWGGLNVIFNMGYSVQIINVKNKDKVFDEKKMQHNDNITCDIVVSDTIHASNYNSFEEFYEDVCVKWEECFYRTSGSNVVVEISNKENINAVSPIYFVGVISIFSLLSYFHLNLFIGVIHVLYIGMVTVSKHISTLKKEHIQSFIFYYNWFQVLLSLTMSIYGITIFNVDNPLLLNNFNENSYIRNFILLHAFSKVVDFIDTAILIVSGKQLSFLHTYHHASIGLIWFYLYNENVNSAYFGAMLNSIVHTIMYFYFNYSHKLKYIKSWITRIQIMQFIILIIHPIIFIYNTENWWYKKLAFFQMLYQFSMIVLFGNFYYRNYIFSKEKRVEN
jgi:1-acyl-sn-glycerol-3-phosphate acyltransferase